MAESNAPVGESNAPMAESNAPVGESNAPMAESNAPTAESNAPTAESNAPTVVRAPVEGHSESAVTSPDGSRPDGVPERPELARRRRTRASRSVEPAPQRPPAVEAVRVGYLTADARPWAAVLLDGHEVERTPLSRFPVPVGSHELVLRGPDGQREVRELHVTEGQVVTVQADFTAR